MWLAFAIAVLLYLVVLYAPGYLVARGIRIARFSSVALAPLFSVFFAVVLGVVLDELGISCHATVLLAGMVTLGLVVFLAGRTVRSRKGSTVASELVQVKCSNRRVWTAAGLYVAFSLLMFFIVFLLGIDGPESFSRNDDTTVHLSVVRAFLDTGTYSTLNTGSYVAQVGGGGYYPAAWHVLTAVVASVFDNNVALATNAGIAAFLVVVFPMGMCLLLMLLFDKKRSVILAGSLVVLSFSGFPWGYVVFGQLLPNMVAFIFVPLTLSLLIGAFNAERASDRVVLAIALCVGLASIALAQPNGAFTFGIWAVLYSANRIIASDPSNESLSLRRRLLAAAVIVVVACALWAAMYCAPFMQGVVQTTWPAVLSLPEGILAGLGFMFMVREGIHPFLSVAVLLGVIYVCRNRRYLWLAVAYAFALVLYVICVSTDGVVKHVLAGFWYTDYYRTGAMTSLFAMPLAALGICSIVMLVRKGLERIVRGEEGYRSGYAAPVLVVALLLACQLAPLHFSLGENRDIYLGLVRIHKEVSTRYSWDKVLTSEEDAFIKKVMDEIPEGALVINVPSDGSCWSYGVEGINTYFRRSSDTGMGGSEESKILRTQLADINSSAQVRELVERIDARYVLILDEKGGSNRTTVNLRYKEENWRGIEDIGEATPGFRLLMSEGDMRLYEIEA